MYKKEIIKRIVCLFSLQKNISIILFECINQSPLKDELNNENVHHFLFYEIVLCILLEYDNFLELDRRIEK